MLYSIKQTPKTEYPLIIDISEVFYIDVDIEECELIIGIGSKLLEIPINSEPRLTNYANLLTQAWEEHKKTKVIDIERWFPTKSNKEVIDEQRRKVGNYEEEQNRELR